MIRVGEIPPRADPQVAAALFAEHVPAALSSQQGRREGWTATWINPLTAILHLHATRANGARDPYHLLLAADWYDDYPPQARFVIPPEGDETPANRRWQEAQPGSRWLPMVNHALTVGGAFALHPAYNYESEGGVVRQLICCSMSFDYYISGHSPTPGQTWQPGRHTVVALLSRVAEALRPPAYQGPTGAVDT